MSQDRNPNNKKNRQLCCKLCGEVFDRESTIGDAQEQHFVAKHNGASVALELKWIGRGPAPKGKPAYLN